MIVPVVRFLYALGLLALLLAAPGCAVVPASWVERLQAAPPAPRAVPVGDCPGPVVVPPAPPAPRTVEAVARFAVRLDEALVKSERARAACAAAFEQLRAATLAQ